MRNIKKLLALMLVMVMALGMVPMVATASDNGFTDADDIEFVEAAGLLDELGIIQGYTDGSFRPAQSVTRAEAVAFIVRMLLTFDVAQRLPDNRSSFTDVLSNPSTAWAAGEIEYAFGEGIVLGRGEGLFDPQGEVTGIEMAAFLLRALGKGAYNDPATWAFNAVADGTREGILTIGPDVDLSAPANREQIALYTFNSLTVDSEDAVFERNFTIRTNATASSLKTNLDRTTYETFLEALMVGEKLGTFYTLTASQTIDDILDGNFIIQATTREVTPAKGGLLETVFNARKSVTFDDFERPQNEYRTVRGVSREVFTSPVEPIARYTTGQSQATLYTAFGGTGTSVTVSHYIDGEIDIDKTLNRNTTTGSVTGTGRGVVTELYKVGEENRVVSINTYVGEIENVRAASGSTARRVDIADITLGSAVIDYETTNFAARDIVIFTFAGNPGKVQDIKLAPSDLEVTVTSTRGTLTAITSDAGTTATFVAGRSFSFNQNYKIERDITSGDILNLYLDDFGNVVLSRTYQAAVGNFLYVVEVEQESSLFGYGPIYARVVFDDGTDKDIRTSLRQTADSEWQIPADVGAASATATVSSFTGDSGVKGEMEKAIYTYSVNNDVYTLRKMDGTLNSVTYSQKDNTGVSITRGTTAITGFGGSEFGNDNTIYVIGNSTSGYRSYTGFRNIPNVSGAGGSVLLIGNRAVIVFLTGSSVVVPGAGFTFVAGPGTNGSETINGTNVLYTEYNAVIDGVISSTDNPFRTERAFTVAEESFVMGSSISRDSAGLVTAVSGLSAGTLITDLTTIVDALDGGVIGLDDGKYNNSDSLLGTDGPFAVAADASVFRVAKNGTISEGTLSDIEQSTAVDRAVALVINTSTGVITTVFYFNFDLT